MSAPADPTGAASGERATGAPAVPGTAAPPQVQRPLIRPAQPGDVPDILAMIHELAEYERSADEVQATEQMVADLLFGSNTPSGVPAAFCHVAQPGALDRGAPLAGMALWFLNASTWTGRHGIYLEDLYVRPEFRGLGVGQALMAELAGICVDRGYARLEWWVLDWNTPALDFYRRLGARAMDEWTVHRITGADLEDLAPGSEDPGGPRR